ncbi:mitochondrial carrier protein MTM [Spatholobus suberectus]|nr:mitochondrial carrier protein MTM [Spatholobus suberectus]
MEEGGAKPVCAEEALALLNCVTQSPYDEDKCLRLLHSLRDCVLAKKVKNFSLAGQEKLETKSSSKKA